jgi:hypothetical protein
MGTAAARQRRWQARNLVKLTAPADDIATKLIGMADRNKLRDIYIALDEHLEPMFEAEHAWHMAARVPGYAGWLAEAACARAGILS